jgi:hypothetical protein
VNVVFLAEARAQRCLPRSNQWTNNEIAELIRLYRAQREQGAAVDFALGITDFEDPQFYVMRDDSGQSCSVCVSRLTRNGQSWYVIENGKGRIEGEGACLRILVAQITKRTLMRWRGVVPILAYFAQQFLGDGAASQDIALAAECLMAIA